MPPDCDKYTETLNRARALIAPERQAIAVRDLTNYLEAETGRFFDGAAVDEYPNEFTEADVDALKYLKVSAKQARPWLFGAGDQAAATLLSQIPVDTDLWDIEPADFDRTLEKGSPAFTLWEEIHAQLEGYRSAGRGVTAGKLLHRKRPRLIPIYDEAAIHKALDVTEVNIWRALWCTFRQTDVREQLETIRAQVPAAESLSLLRVLDIIAWKSVMAAPG